MEISLISSLTIAVITFINNQRLQRLTNEQQKKLVDINNTYQQESEKLKTQLVGEKSEQDARRDYEYEARKRLYQEY
jgi:hypothetical protein